MPRNSQIHLVIDANIARSAGTENATHPTSKQCRDCLISVDDNNFTIGSNPELLGEWRRHGSGFWRRWYLKMMSQKRVTFLPASPGAELREKLELCAANEGEREAIRKDCHLLEGALVFDRRILSSDDRIRRHFALACSRVGEIREIAWADPTNAEEKVIEWLSTGAPLESKRKLRSYLANSG